MDIWEVRRGGAEGEALAGLLDWTGANAHCLGGWGKAAAGVAPRAGLSQLGETQDSLRKRPEQPGGWGRETSCSLTGGPHIP